jgi:hypothetical protein
MELISLQADSERYYHLRKSPSSDLLYGGKKFTQHLAHLSALAMLVGIQ